MAEQTKQIVMRGQPLVAPGQRAVVVGAGASGLAAARLLERLGARVRLLERDLENAARVKAMAVAKNWEVAAGKHGRDHFANVSLVVLSPGVNLRLLGPWLDNLPRERVISELELAYRCITEPIIAVTGTSGKTTTTTLIGSFLRAMGQEVFVGGNIGTPLSEYVLEGGKARILVLEVSSFQLLTSPTFRPQVGVFLNISPNHLDYHVDMDEYLGAKLSMFARQQESDTAVFPEQMRMELGGSKVTKARRIFFQPDSQPSCAALPGRHNQANIAAAFAACQVFGLAPGTAEAVLEKFQSLPHRLQPVVEKHGVLFVDDSKGTTVHALQAALEAFDRPILLLAGGVFKGGDVAALSPLLRRKVRQVGLFGGSRDVFEHAWAKVVPLSWDPSLEQAMDRLWALAKPGDVMLLSPATASFDLFADYKARGSAFQRRAQTLKGHGHGRHAA